MKPIIPKTWLYRSVASLCLSSVAALGAGQLQQISWAQTPAIVETQPAIDSITDRAAAQLIGQWQFAFPNAPAPINLVFVPNGELLLVDPGSETLRFTWTVDIIDQQPTMTADLGLLRLVGILANSDVMPLRLIAQYPDDSYEAEEIAVNARKVSSEATPPAGTVTDAADFYRNQAIAARQMLARTQVNQINRVQQHHFLQHQSFTTDTQVIGVYLQPSDDYEYQISLSNTGQIANILALPTQPGLSAYVGRVGLTEDNAIPIQTNAIICQSTEPTDQMPVIPADDLQCPNGYQLPTAQIADLSNPRLVKAVEIQASVNLNTINRTQQTIFLEDQQFEDDLQSISTILSIDLQQDNYYDYQLILSDEGQVASTIANPKDNQLPAFISSVAISPDDALRTITLQCKSIQPNRQRSSLPRFSNGTLVCPDGYVTAE